MKKFHLIILFFLLTYSLRSQNIPNGNFESWTFNSFNNSYEPTEWFTSNYGGDGDTGVYRYKPARTGNLACGFKTNFIMNTYTMPGILDISFPTTLKPNGMEGYFKGNMALNDTAIIFIEFSKDSNVIADGSLFFTQSENNYTKFVVPIDFFGAGDPDTCTITIIGGGFDPDDTLTAFAIDDLDFVFPISVKKVTLHKKDNILLYPNPANDILNISSEEAYSSVVIYNQTGQVVGTFRNETSIFIGTYGSGLYYLQLLDEDQQVVAKQSFIKN